MHLGFGEIVIVLALAMLLFGPNRIKGVAGALGESVRSFKKGMAGEDEVKPAGAVAANPTSTNGQPPPPTA